MQILKCLALLILATMFWFSDACGADIHDAAQAGNLDSLMVLVQADPTQVQAVDRLGRTPLHWACRGVHFEIIKYLISHGANVNAVDVNGITPLHSVASRGHTEGVRLLIAKGAALEAQGKLDLGSPLHYAAQAGHTEVVRLLIASGARVDSRNIEERTPLSVAALAGKAEVVQLLSEHVKSGNVETLNARDFDGNTALHLACLNGDTAVAAILLRAGVESGIRNAVGQTPYNVAFESKSLELTKLLADKGVDSGPAQFPLLKGLYLGETPPDTTPKLFAKGILSTSRGVHSCIEFSPDLCELVWNGGDTIYLMKMQDSVWVAPIAIPFFKPHYSLDAPFFSFDGRRIYFLAGELSPEGMSGDQDIWYMSRTADGWSSPVLFDSVVNSVPIHWQVSMSRNGDFYISNRAVFCSRFAENRYATPEKLSPAINTVPDSIRQAGCVAPFISPDGDYLIFTRFNPRPSARPTDFLISFKRADGSWGTPQDLGAKLGGNGMAARLSPDGKYLFFMSDRPGSARERSIYWVDAKVIKEMEPTDLK